MSISNKEHKKEFKYDKPIIKRISYDYKKSANQNTTEQKANGLIDLFYAILDKFPPTSGTFTSLAEFYKKCDFEIAKEIYDYKG